MQIDLYPQRPLSFARQTDCHFCVCNPATYHIYAQFRRNLQSVQLTHLVLKN